MKKTKLLMMAFVIFTSLAISACAPFWHHGGGGHGGGGHSNSHGGGHGGGRGH